MYEKFARDIEAIREETGLNYLDSVLLFCHRHDCEIETAAAIIKKDPALKSKVMAVAGDLKLLKAKSTGNTLPI
jgi:hypothetical protein